MGGQQQSRRQAPRVKMDRSTDLDSPPLSPLAQQMGEEIGREDPLYYSGPGGDRHQAGAGGYQEEVEEEDEDNRSQLDELGQKRGTVKMICLLDFLLTLAAFYLLLQYGHVIFEETALDLLVIRTAVEFVMVFILLPAEDPATSPQDAINLCDIYFVFNFFAIIVELFYGWTFGLSRSEPAQGLIVARLIIRILHMVNVLNFVAALRKIAGGGGGRGGNRSQRQLLHPPRPRALNSSGGNRTTANDYNGNFVTVERTVTERVTFPATSGGGTYLENWRQRQQQRRGSGRRLLQLRPPSRLLQASLH